MNKAELKAAGTPATKKVIIRAWNNAEVTIRRYMAADIFYAREAAKTGELTEGQDVAKAVVRSLLDDETGALMYQDTPEDIAELLSLGFDGLVELAAAINDFNGANVEALEKNSEASQS